MPNSKNDKLRKIDIKPAVKGGGSLITSAQEIAPPAIGTIPAPLNLRLIDTVIARSTQAPMAYINIAWNAPTNVTPEYYEIEFGKSSEWTGSEFTNPSRPKVYNTDAALLVDADTDYKIRVRAVYRNTVSKWTPVLSVHSAEDVTPPPDFDSYSADFENGNLIVLWDYLGANPENFKHSRIEIYDATHTTLYATLTDVTGRFIWTEAANIAASAGLGVTSVSVDITPVSWTNTDGDTFNDTATSVAPNPISSLAHDFSTGDLELSWTNPTNAPFRFIRVKIYASDGGALYRTIETVSENFTWTVANNFADTGNNPDASVYVTVQVIAWLNQASSIVDAEPVKAPPAAPANVYTSWDSDAGRADENLVISWDAVTYATEYQVSIGGEIVELTGYTYTYSYSENVADNLSPGDPTLTIEVKARDRLLQLSTSPTTNNATNAAPSDTFFTLDVTPGFSSVGGIVVFNTTIHDLKTINWIIRNDALAIVQERNTLDTVSIFLDLDSGDYTLEVVLIDMFDQESDPVISDPFTIDALTIEELRQGLQYTDIVSNTPATLDVLKDNELTGSYVEYTNSAYPAYMWTQAEWPLLERVRTITFSIDAWTGEPSFYVATSPDGVDWTYFAGPVTSTRVLTEVANEAAAQAADVFFEDIGTRVDLPDIYEVRFARIYHRADVDEGVYRMFEFFPRRLVQSDDIEVESIKAINIAAGAITADKITVTTLGAIQTSTGTLVINTGGHIRSGMTAWNTGTGYYFDNNGGTPRFMIGNSSGTKFYWDGSTLNLEGSSFTIKTAIALPYAQITSAGFRVVGTLGQILFDINATTGKVTFGDWVAQTGEPSGTEGALSFGSGTGTSAGTTQRIQIWDDADANPTSTNIHSYWHHYRAPSITVTGVNTGPRTEFVGTNGDNGGTANTLLVAQATAATNTASVYLRAIGSSTSVVFRVDSDGTMYINRGTSQPVRNAIEDTNDGWLRLNQDEDYANGVYTPGLIRADGNGYFGTSGLGRIGTHPSYASSYGVWRSTDDYALLFDATNTYVNSRSGTIFFRDNNTSRVSISSAGMTVVSNVTIQGGALLVDRAAASAVQVRSSDNDNNLIIYNGSASDRVDIWARDYANSAYIRMFIGTTALAIGSIAPAGSQRVRINSTGDTNTHYPLIVTSSSGGASLFYIRSASSTTCTGILADTAWTYTSDENMKEDIVDIPPQKDKLKQLKPKRFKYKGSDDYRAGFTAQDVQQVYPDLVEEIQVGEGEIVLGLRTTDLIPMMVEEMIALREEIETLKKPK